MILLNNEQILWESKNKRLILTTHRLREMNKSFYGSSIKSIMLEDLTSSELRTTREYYYLRKALLYFLIMNIVVYILNHYLFQAELFKYFFEEVHIGPQTSGIIFYISIAVAMAYIIGFFLSVKKVFSFYATYMKIEFQLRWLDFEEQESFISIVEAAKDNRFKNLYGKNAK